MSQRRGGLIQLQANGQLYDVKGDFTYNIGAPKREAIIGADKVHGFTETPQVAFIEGEVTDSPDLSLKDLMNLENATVVMPLANGKAVVLRDAWQASDGNVGTKEGNIAVRFEAPQGEEV